MITALNISIGLLWFISALIDYSEFCHLWQLKEYRTDRLRDFFSTKQGQRFWLSYSLFWRSIAALVLAFWPINQLLTFKYAILLGFIIDLLHNIWRYHSGKIRRPKFTVKACVIIGLVVLAEAFLVVNDRDWGDIPFVVILRFPLLSFIVLCLNKITAIIKKWYILQATHKLEKYPELIVIGVTGSYGKSSVKEFLSQILSQRYAVIKTPKNVNTDIGIARFVLRNNFFERQVFVVEMAAYRIGEIKKICDMVKPRIGVLTAIIGQHLSLFGSLKNIQLAKYELLRSLPEDGFIVTNADNPLCLELLSELRCKNVATFGLDSEKNPDCLITEVKFTLSSLQWKEFCKSSEANEATAPVIGAHQVLNISAAALVAKHLGLTAEELNSAYQILKPGENGLKIYKYGQSTVIDDSYNSNPVGFKSALDILTKFSSTARRVVITRGMLELGHESNEAHEKIAEEIAFCANELIVITPDFFEAFKKGIEKIKDKYFKLECLEIYDAKKLLRKVREYKNTKAVILLENRIPKIVRDELMSSN